MSEETLSLEMELALQEQRVDFAEARYFGAVARRGVGTAGLDDIEAAEANLDAEREAAFRIWHKIHHKEP